MEANQESPTCEFDDSDKDFEASPGAASLQTSQTSEISTPRLVYNRDFLLQLQYSELSMQRPEYLPNIPEIFPYKTPSNLFDIRQDIKSGAQDWSDMTPGFLKPSRRSPSNPFMDMRSGAQDWTDMTPRFLIPSRGARAHTESEKTVPVLKYKYKQDQWSPLNPEGKIQYDREFLFQLQYSENSMKKPDALPNFPDIIPDKPFSKPSMDISNYRDLPEFTPGFLRLSREMGGGKGFTSEGLTYTFRKESTSPQTATFLKPVSELSDGQGSAAGTKVEQTKSTDHSESSLTPENSSERPDESMKQTIRPTPDTGTHLSYQRKFSALPLPQSEIDPERVARVLTHLKRPDGQRYQVDEIPAPMSPNTEATQEREEELYRKIRSILNKLTPQTFQTLIKQVQDLVIDTETRLKGVTDIIWEQVGDIDTDLKLQVLI